MSDQNNAPERLKNLIYHVLRDYRQIEVVDEEGDGYPLVDALTITGQGIDMGEREIANIADTLAYEIARADRAAPEGQVGALRDAHALTPPPAAPTDNAALVEEQRMKEHYRNCWKAQLERANGLEAALASREPPPACQQEAMPVGCGQPCGYDCNGACFDPPACQQEAVTEIAEAKEILSQIGAYAGGMDYSRIVTAVGHIDAALRALKGERG